MANPIIPQSPVAMHGDRRPVPVRARLSIPLGSYNETTLAGLRALLDLAEHLPDSTAVSIFIPDEDDDHGEISIAFDCEVRA